MSLIRALIRSLSTKGFIRTKRIIIKYATYVQNLRSIWRLSFSKYSLAFCSALLILEHQGLSHNFEPLARKVFQLLFLSCWLSHWGSYIFFYLRLLLSLSFAYLDSHPSFLLSSHYILWSIVCMNFSQLCALVSL